METSYLQASMIEEAVRLLQKDELVAFPTETVYGLGANALSEKAVKKVFEVKGRPSDNPLIVHVADFEQVKHYVETFHPLTQTLIDYYWPGPLTLIVTPKEGVFPAIVSAGLKTVSFRMPNNEQTLKLIKKSGLPLVGPSANTSGKPSPTRAEHVYHDLNGKIAGILDDGETSIGIESTVLDISDVTQPPMILRPGAITKEQLEYDLGMAVRVDRHLITESEAPKSPGMKYKHYSPNTKVVMVHEKDWSAALEFASDKRQRAGIMAGPTIADRHKGQAAESFVFDNDSVQAATKGLFAGLRALDEAKNSLDVIYVAVFPEVDLGVAYMNRLKKAAAQEYFVNY